MSTQRKEINISVPTTYGGHVISNSKTINLTLKFGYDTITDYIRLISALNEDVKVYSWVGTERSLLGNFKITSINIDRDGNSKIKFTSLIDFVELAEINKIIGLEVFRAVFVASVEYEDDENGD